VQLIFRINSTMALRVFVVDDEKSIATTTTQILQLSGYDARSFLNPEKALEAARVECPNLVVADVMMPRLSGIDLAVSLEELCPSCKVILFSGQAETSDLLDAALAKGHEFTVLAKPIPPAKLLQHLREAAGC
jgi:DNA-binding NtrC family response regulator